MDWSWSWEWTEEGILNYLRYAIRAIVFDCRSAGEVRGVGVGIGGR